MRKKIAAYVRVSTAKQKNDGVSIDMQQEMIVKYALMIEAIENSTEIEFYIDDGYSAKSLERPRMKDLINDIKENKIELLFSYDLSRLSREMFDCNSLLKLLKKNNVILKCIYDNVDMKTASERFSTSIKILHNQYEREKVIERTNDGLISLVEKGKYPCGGKIIFGYFKGEDKRLYIHPTDSLIIKKIFNMASRGYNLAEIELIVKDMETSRPIKLNRATISRLLMCKKYYGYYKYKGKEYSNIIPAIITENQFLMVQERKVNHHKCGENYIFHNRIICRECSKFLHNTQGTSKTGTVYYYYKCPVCGKYVNENKLSEMFLVKEPEKEYTNEKKKILRKYVAKKYRLNNKLITIKNDYLNDYINEREYLDLSSAVEEGIKKNNDKIDNIKNDFLNKKRYIDMSTKKERINYISNNVDRVYYDFKKKDITKIIMKK